MSRVRICGRAWGAERTNSATSGKVLRLDLDRAVRTFERGMKAGRQGLLYSRVKIDVKFTEPGHFT